MEKFLKQSNLASTPQVPNICQHFVNPLHKLFVQHRQLRLYDYFPVSRSSWLGWAHVNFCVSVIKHMCISQFYKVVLRKRIRVCWTVLWKRLVVFLYRFVTYYLIVLWIQYLLEWTEMQCECGFASKDTHLLSKATANTANFILLCNGLLSMLFSQHSAIQRHISC